MLVSSCGHYDSWLVASHQAALVSRSLDICSLVAHLLDLARHGNNMAKRGALHAMHAFVPTLCKSSHANLALDLVSQLLHFRHSTYNLVKCELVDLLASLDYRAIAAATAANPRANDVRLETARALARFVLRANCSDAGDELRTSPAENSRGAARLRRLRHPHARRSRHRHRAPLLGHDQLTSRITTRQREQQQQKQQHVFDRRQVEQVARTAPTVWPTC